MKLRNYKFLLLLLLGACGAEPPEAPAASLDALAAEYLFLELSMSLHDEAHVDAYFGPAEIRENAEQSALPLAEIESRAAAMATRLLNWPVETGDGMLAARIRILLQRLQALTTRIALSKGESFSFDEESRRLFGTAAPDYDAAHFEAILGQIDALLEGEGDLPARVNRFRNQFVIPPNHLGEVFDAAIAECRRRTHKYIEPDQYGPADIYQPGGGPRLSRGLPGPPHI